MQLVPDGPNIPIELFQALEEGRLVLFCGAGVSMRAGLPNFKRMVQQVYGRLGVPPPKGSTAWKALDRLLQALDELPNSRMRTEVVSLLNVAPTGSLESHVSILRLASGLDGAIRFVTTNFDDYFSRAAKAESMTLSLDVAPKLPVPKPSKWQGLVHLHGHIEGSDSDGLGLILTSADFGTAYLTEGWAGRFMSELFRHYSVLFVGYSVDDPVMRYMVDALAADRQAQGGVRKAYAFLGYDKKSKVKVNAAFPSQQSIETIEYHSRQQHRLLHTTLAKWAELYAGRLTAREALIKRLAPRPPSFLAPYEIEQVIWAVSDESGYGAKVFAQLEQAPPIEWLDMFDKEGFLGPITSVPQSPEAKLVSNTFDHSLMMPLSKVTQWMMLWLSRHVCENRLLEWLLARGGILHLTFRDAIRGQLEFYNPIPHAATRVWRILSDDSILNSTSTIFSLLGVVKRIEFEGWTVETKRQLLAALEPQLQLSPPISPLFKGTSAVPTRVADFVEGWVKLAAGDHARYMIEQLRKLPDANLILADISEEITALLLRAFDLFASVGTAMPGYDLSYVNRPSIVQSSQNFDFYEWTLLVDLVYAGFQALDSSHPKKGKNILDSSGLLCQK